MSDCDCRCDDCGRFMDPTASGSSSARMYDFVAMECDYEHWRCSSCSARLGQIRSNARPHNGDMTPYETHITIE
jgi:hypothetical protein